ncbi:MAG: GNAT family N-acetyltransferase [Aggregatilineales bacterium]
MREYPSKRADLRLLVRAQRADDWQGVYAIREQDSVRPNVLAVPFSDPERFRERATHTGDLEHRIVAEAIFADDSRLLVGSLGLHRGKMSGADRAGFGIQVHADYQGIGVGNALMAAMCNLADNWLNLHRLELEVFTDNEGAIALYKKYGFEIEGTRRRSAFRNGVYGDTYWMGRINPQHAGSKGHSTNE